MFDGADVYQYRREKNSGEQPVQWGILTGRGDSRRKKSMFRLGVRDMAGAAVVLSAGFLLGRSVLLGELFPFGPAFAAAVIVVYRGLALPVLLGAALGVYTVAGGWELAVRSVSLVVAGVAALSLPSRASGLHFLLGGTVFAVLVVTGTGYVALTGPSNYEYIRVLFEAVFGALLSVAFFKALTGLQQAARRERVAPDVMFCLVLLLASVVAAASQIQWGYITPGGILAGLAVLVAGYAGGGGLGASAGAVMGVLPGLVYTVSPAAAGAAAFAGFLGGVCRALGRMGVVAGFLMGNVLITVYLGSGRDILGVLGESAAASLVFALVPGALLNRLRTYLPITQPWDSIEGSGPAGNNVRSGRLRRWGGVFDEISHIYERVGQARETGVDKTDRRGLVDELRVLVCSGCPLQGVCWGKEAQSTCRTLEHLRTTVEQQGKVEPGDLDRSFTDRCSRSGEMVRGMNCLYRLQRMKRSWENCVRDGREMVYGHLRGMRGVVDNLVREAEAEKDVWLKRAEYLKRELKQADMPVSDLVLYPGAGGCEVEVTIPSCGGLKKCLYDVAPLLGRLTGQELSPAFMDCVNNGGTGFCNLRLYSGLKYRVDMGLTRLPAGSNAVSGDSHSVVQLSGGRLVFLLSDGMGSGPAAAAESGAALALLKQLLQAGFDAEPAIRTVNWVMMKRTLEESFATVDMLLVDLYAGEAKIIKIGAAPSFRVRRDAVDTIRSNSPPVGIIDEITVFSRDKKIAAGDLLVMVTDGVIDAHRETNSDEEWVAGVLREIIDLPPGEVADLVVKLALGGGNGPRVADDMTVLAVRVEKNC